MIAAKRAVHIQKVRAAPADIEPQQRRNICNVERKLRRTGSDNGHTLSSKPDASSGFLLQIVQQDGRCGFENIVRLIAAIEIPFQARRTALRDLFERQPRQVPICTTTAFASSTVIRCVISLTSISAV